MIFLDKKISNDKTDFNPDCCPQNPVNIRAAEERGLKYDRKKGFYIDEDGCLIRDRYGQDL